jgi:hypothetical protein
VKLAPYLVIGAAITLLVSHVKSRNAQKEMAKNPYHKYFGVPRGLQSGWEACNVRNTSGYASIGLGGSILAIGMIAARAGLLVL